MRHFLRAPRAPGALTRRVRTRSAVAELVALAGAAQRLAPANPRALTGTVAIAAVAVAADAHLLRTAPAAVEPIRLLACPHAPHTRPLDNAAYCGHKGNANAPLCAPACRRPGVLSRNVPGPSLLRRPDLRIAAGPRGRRGACASAHRASAGPNHRGRFNQTTPLATRASN